MELRVLRYFLAVAREGTISRAAQYLHVTQPTLSRQLQDLEEELGQKLFLRSNHTITLTPEGMLLRKRAEEVMELIQKTEAEFNSFGENIAGTIHIGGGETEAMRQVFALMRDLKEDYPDIRYHLFSGNADDVLERLDKGTLDFGVLIDPVDISKYDYVRLPQKDTWGIVMPKDHPLATRKTIAQQDLRGLPIICPRRFTSANAYTGWFGRSLEKMNIVATFNLVYNATLMVEEGLGCALTIDKLMFRNSPDLCFRPLEPRLESGLNIIWKKYQVFSKPAEIFLKKLNENFANAGSPC